LALFNGSPLPSPEPLIQVVPLDLFPTGVLQGIEVQKSYSPDMPGAFGAGLVRLNTRGVPEEDFLKLSVSTGYNTISTFEDGLTYQGGSYDWLGFDDGTRALPDSVDATTAGGTISLDDRTQITEDQKNEAGQTFPGIYNTRSTTLPPDLGLGVTAGGSFSLPANGSFGIIGTVGYGNQWRFQERIQRSFALSNEELRVRDDTIENRTDNDVELSGLLTAAASWDNHEISLNTFVVNQTQQRTEFTTGREIGSSQLDIERSLLSWIERFLAAQQITGRHDFEWLLLEYRGLYAVAQRDAPDRREYTYSRAPAQDQFFIRDPSGAFRSYSFVDDTRLSFGLDLSTDVLASEESWLRIVPKVGLAVNNTDRDAGEQRFVWRPSDDADRSIRDPEEIFDPALTGTLLDLRDNSILGADDYTGSSDIFGLYAMADIEFGDLFRLVGGVRRETADYLVETFQLADAESVAASAGFDETDYLPSASLTWFALDELQIRAAYGRTVSRPVFNELSTSSFFDPDTGQQFQGNPNLVPTVIDGYDIRVEWYPSTTESFSVGAFLKDYTDPLERTFVALGGGGFIATFQNADSAEVLGIEFGGRAELQRIREWLGGPSFLEDIYVSANAAILDSEVELTEQGIATDTARPLDGQADIVVNVQAGFDTEEHDLTIAYNLVGTRLRRAGVLAQPNIFQDPIDTLDLNYTWQITDEAALKASASNLLNPSTRLTQQVEGDEEQVFREFKRGRGFGLGFSYSFK
ncbi:MAG: TonB-dependent receptor, partial [Myxococcota bacterium]